MREGAYIIVVQQHDSITRMIQRFLGDTPNRIDYFSSPSQALETAVAKSLRDGFPDVIITGEKFYTGKNPSSGGQLAKAVHELRPGTLVLRYSVDAEESPLEFGINGDIPKEGNLGPITSFLEDAELKRTLREKRWDDLKARHPDIRFYENLP